MTPRRRQPQTPEEEVRNAQVAHRLQSDPAFRDAIDTCTADCHRQWESAMTVEERERQWARLQALVEIENELNVRINNGEYAKAKMEREAR